jgi:hypothetical protein
VGKWKGELWRRCTQLGGQLDELFRIIVIAIAITITVIAVKMLVPVSTFNSVLAQ